jgi:hypothetical protein
MGIQKGKFRKASDINIIRSENANSFTAFQNCGANDNIIILSFKTKQAYFCRNFQNLSLRVLVKSLSELPA